MMISRCFSVVFFYFCVQPKKEALEKFQNSDSEFIISDSCHKRISSLTLSIGMREKLQVEQNSQTNAFIFHYTSTWKERTFQAALK